MKQDISKTMILATVAPPAILSFLIIADSYPLKQHNNQANQTIDKKGK